MTKAMRTRHILCMLLTTAALSSCVRDEIEPCPPLQVNITVKDKNYFNVDKVELEERLPENLAFREYIPTLHYTLRDAATGEVVEEQGVFTVEGDGKTFPITFCDCIPHGKYILTVWGGLDDINPLADDRTSVAFHPESMEENDIYLTNDTLVYDAWNYDYTVDMERTKGKLVIQAANLPASIDRTDKSVNGLYGKVGSDFKYSDETRVYTETRWNAPVEIVTKTVLAPSVQKDGSVLDVNFYTAAGNDIPVFMPKKLNITMKRNELTVLRYVYDEGKGDFTIYILVNAAWQQVVDLDIQE